MRARRLAALILSASAMAGGASGPATTGTSSPAPPGTVKSADGQFATVIPNGFANALGSVQATIKIQYLAAAPSHDGFATNINVVAEAAGSQTSIDTIAGLE